MRGRKGKGGGGAGGSGGHSMQALIKQANQMQTKMKQLEDELKEKDYTATSGGGAVQAVVRDTKLQKLTIDPEVLKDGDAEILQDMVTTAVNEALTTAKTEHDEQIEGLSKGMNLPGMG